MRKFATATVFSGALLLTTGMALAQTSSTTGVAPYNGSAAATARSTGSSSGSGSMSSSATSTGHPMTSDADVKQQLKAEGYSDITNVKHEGDHYTANAKQNGETVKLRVDASNGMVSKEHG